MTAWTQGSTSSAVGSIRVAWVIRSGKGSTIPAEPRVSGIPPRSDPMTGMPFTIASTATKG